MLRRISENIGWLLAERLVRIVLGLLVTVLVARYLGPAEYGELSFAFAYAALLGAIGGLGLDSITVRELSQHEDKAGRILATVALLRLVGGLFVMATGIGIMWLDGSVSESRVVLVAIVLAGFLFQPVDVVDYWFQAHLNSRLTVVARLSSLVVAAALKLSMIYLAAPVLAFAIIALIESALVAVMLVSRYRSHPCDHALRWDPALARSILADSLPIMLSGLAIMIYMRIDQVMLRELGGPTQLGLFSAVVPFSEGWYVIGVSVCNSLMPTFARSFGVNRELFFDHLQRLFAGLSAVGLSISIVISVGSSVLVAVLLGPRYQEAAVVLAVHAWCIVFVFLGVAENLWLISGNMARLRIAKTVIGAVTNVALNAWLIPKFGALGAAIATVVSFAASVYLSNYFLARDIFFMQSRALVLRFRRRKMQ